MSFGQKLREARKKAGYTQAQLAGMLDISDSTITSWEKETRQPDIPNIKKLTQVLGVSAEYLLEIDSDETKNAPTDDGEGVPKNEHYKIIMEELRAFLIRCGFIRDSEDITDDRLEAILVLLQALFHS